MMNCKKQQRKVLRKIRDELPLQLRQNQSQVICEELMKLLSNEKVIMSFYPIGSEVDVLAFNNALVNEGKVLCYPVCDGTNMEAYQALRLKEGMYGIMEPDCAVCPKIEKEQIEAIVIPCLGYDEKGHRIGYGKGYYDRYLENYQGKRILVAFHQQQQPFIVVDEHDQMVDWILNDQKSMQCGQKA